jgi:hypothetical protein
VLEWVIRKLKGNSDARSRSNYFVIVMTAMALSQIVAGLTGLFALIPVPFIAVAPALLGIVASLISLYVSYVWVRFFEMHKVIPILVLIGMALTGITGLLGVFNLVSAGGAVVAAGGAGGGAAIPADAQAAIEKARADAEKAIAEASKAAGTSAEDMKAADEKVKAALAAGAKAAASDDAAKAKAEAAAENVGREAKVKEELEKQKAEEARAEVEKAKATAEKAAAEKVAAEKAVDTAKAAPIEDDEPAARPSGGYAAWATKRDAVEKAIKEDPTLLRRKDVLGLYETYTRVEFDVRKSYNAKRNKNEPWRDKIIERNIAADTYDRTRDTIEKLHAALF